MKNAGWKTLTILLLIVTNTTIAATSTSTRDVQLYTLTSANFDPNWQFVDSSYDFKNYGDPVMVRFTNDYSSNSSTAYWDTEFRSGTCFPDFTYVGAVRGPNQTLDNAQITIQCRVWGYENGQWVNHGLSASDLRRATIVNFDISFLINGVPTRIDNTKFSMPAGLPNTNITLTLGYQQLGFPYDYSEIPNNTVLPLFVDAGKQVETLQLTVPDSVSMSTNREVRIPLTFTGTVTGSNLNNANATSIQRARIDLTQLDSNLSLGLEDEQGGVVRMKPNVSTTIEFPQSGVRELKFQVESPGDYGTKQTQLRIDATIH